MMTSSNGNIFRVTGPLCGEFTGPGEFPTQRPVTRSFDVFFDLRLNKRLSKQPWGWWFETPSWSLWRHRNVSGSIAVTQVLLHSYSERTPHNSPYQANYGTSVVRTFKKIDRITTALHSIIMQSNKFCKKKWGLPWSVFFQGNAVLKLK